MGQLRALLRLDWRNLRRDSLLPVVLASPLLLALALRWGYPAAESWAAGVHGLHLAGHRGLLLALLVVVHVLFLFGMVGALLVLDEADDGALLAVRVSPVTLAGYLGYRVGAVTGCTLLGLGIAVPLAAMVPRLPATVIPALVLAGATAPVVTLAVLALARNKVEGMAVVKLLSLPVYLPLLTWVVEGRWTWGLALVPTYWPLRALRTGLAGSVDGAALAVGAVYLAAAFAGLRRRCLQRW